jgi:hypothetical protein
MAIHRAGQGSGHAGKRECGWGGGVSAGIADLLVRNAKLVAACDGAGRELPGGWVAITGGVITGVGTAARRGSRARPGPGQRRAGLPTVSWALIRRDLWF